jgi:hypothetical protein
MSPEMNPSELVDHIRSGPTELVLHEPLRFLRRTRSNPCDFSEFLQALQSSETIRTVKSYSHLDLCITEDEWIRLVKTLGGIKDIQNLQLYCKHGSSNFRPFQAVADAVNGAQSLRKLEVTVPKDSRPLHQSGVVALADALRQHPALERFICLNFSLQEAQQDTKLDPVLRALSACPHLQTVTIMTNWASSDALRNLMRHSPTAAQFYLGLVLNTDHWMVVANEISQGRNNIGVLTLYMLERTSPEATEAVKAIANAIRQNHNLKCLELRMESGFTDDAGVALAEALAGNKTLRAIKLGDIVRADHRVHNKDTLGAQAYKAFSAMLRVNTSLILKLPRLDTAGGDQRVIESRKQMGIEQRLNKVGRGTLLSSSSQTTRGAWVDALHKLNAANVDDTPAFQVSCLYSLLRLNPAVCILQLNDTSKSGL